MAAELEPYTSSYWAVIQEEAKVLASSWIVPKAYQGNPNAIIAAALYGREIGLGPVASLSYIHVIEGRPALSAEGMAALVRARGHSITGWAGPDSAEVVGRRRDTGDEMKVTWTREMAQRAGLLSRPTWKSYPEAMLWARAVSQLCRMLFPEVLMGLSYTPEEVRDIVAVEGPAQPPCGVDADTGVIEGPPLVEQMAAEDNMAEAQAKEWASEDALAKVMPSIHALEAADDKRPLNRYRRELHHMGISWKPKEWSVIDCQRVATLLQQQNVWVDPRSGEGPGADPDRPF